MTKASRLEMLVTKPRRLLLSPVWTGLTCLRRLTASSAILANKPRQQREKHDNYYYSCRVAVKQ